MINRLSNDESRHELALRMAAAAIGASASLLSLDAAIAGTTLTPFLEDMLGHIYYSLASRRREHAAQTLTDAADEIGAETPEQFVKFIETALSDAEHQELLARALTIAQDTAMRDKRRALGRALAAAVSDTGTKVDDELVFIRVLADLDEAHIRALRIMTVVPTHLSTMGLEARQWYPWSIAQADPGLADTAWTLLRLLEHHALIWSSGEQLVPGGREPEYTITPYGEWFLTRLVEGS
jgi:hypothetical protein